jgi:hypothetical protein
MLQIPIFYSRDGDRTTSVIASEAWLIRHCERSAAVHDCEFGLWIAALRSQ